jgi:isopentenyl-diphosphate delta-isomerase
VDEADRPLGTEEKLTAHRAGVLHRAVSVIVRNSRGELLLQRRALGKYHSGGLWSNACCGHPRPGESVVAAGERRLREEMGVSCALAPHTAFVYRAALGGALVEHEYDHILVGTTDDEPAPDPTEAMSWEWVEPDLLAARVAAAPERFTAWLPLVLARLG